MRLVIEDEAGTRSTVPFTAEEIVVGREEGVTFRVPDRNVSRRHARFVLCSGAVFVEDLGSLTGTRVNGERLTARRKLREGDLVQISDYDLAVVSDAAALSQSPEGAPPPPPLPARPTPPAPAAAPAPPAPASAPAVAPAPASLPAEAAAPEHVPVPTPAPAPRRRPNVLARVLVAAVVSLALGAAAGFAIGKITARPGHAGEAGAPASHAKR
jgi:hypothetical protein